LKHTLGVGGENESVKFEDHGGVWETETKSMTPLSRSRSHNSRPSADDGRRDVHDC
jgi:hypothetical protein